MSTSTTPVSRRLARPRWFDPRVLGGVLLVVTAVVVGAKVIGASSRTVPVWAAGRPLAPGTVLVEGDLVAIEVNLGGAGPEYLDTASSPVGRTVTAEVGQGELLPAALLREEDTGRLVVVDIAPDRMPPGVVHGSRVDLYLTTELAGDKGAQTSVLATDLTVQSVQEPASGGLSGATSDRYRIAVLLEPTAAGGLVRRLSTGEVTAVLITGAQR